MSQAVVLTDTQLLQLLRAQREARPDLHRVLDIHLALTALRAEQTPRVAPGFAAQAAARLGRDETALRPEELLLDWEELRRLAQRLATVSAAHHLSLARELLQLADVLGDASAGELRLIVIEHLAATPICRHGEMDLLAFILTQALRPTLAAHAAVVVPLLGDRPWPHGACPVCAGRPDFAVFDGHATARRLLCARCDGEWRYARAGCPFCGNDSADSLRYLMAGDGAYRVDLCERCKHYLKSADFREVAPRHPLPVERLITVGLDVAATGRGFRPCG